MKKYRGERKREEGREAERGESVEGRVSRGGCRGERGECRGESGEGRGERNFLLIQQAGETSTLAGSQRGFADRRVEQPSSAVRKEYVR